MTSFQTLLCIIPKNIHTKQIFVEISFVSDFLSKYKKYLTYAYEFINVIEKSYRSSASSLDSMSEKLPGLVNNMPESNIFACYANSHQKRTKVLLDRANSLADLQKRQFKTLLDNFDTKRKSLENQLNNLKQLVQPSLDDIYKSLNGYDKYFIKLQQSVTQQQQSPAYQQNFQKALTKLDEKLSRTQTNYNCFHTKFAEYCSIRDKIFGEIDRLIADTSEELKKILKQAVLIDRGFIDQIDFNQPKTEIDLSSCWTETKEEPKNDKFYVTLLSNILCGTTRLNVNQTFTVVEAKGDYWIIEDENRNKWEVPSENLKVKLK